MNNLKFVNTYTVYILTNGFGNTASTTNLNNLHIESVNTYTFNKLIFNMLSFGLGIQLKSLKLEENKKILVEKEHMLKKGIAMAGKNMTKSHTFKRYQTIWLKPMLTYYSKANRLLYRKINRFQTTKSSVSGKDFPKLDILGFSALRTGEKKGNDFHSTLRLDSFKVILAKHIAFRTSYRMNTVCLSSEKPKNPRFKKTIFRCFSKEVNIIRLNFSEIVLYASLLKHILLDYLIYQSLIYKPVVSVISITETTVISSNYLRSYPNPLETIYVVYCFFSPFPIEIISFLKTCFECLTDFFSCVAVLKKLKILLAKNICVVVMYISVKPKTQKGV